MPYLMQMTDFRPDDEIQKSLDAAIAEAQRTLSLPFEGPYPRTGLGISNLTPRMVGATNQASGLQGGVAASHVWGVTAVTSATITNWINLNLDDRLFVVWTGVFNRTNSPRITHIKPIANGEEMPLFSIEEMYTWDNVQAWLTKPMIIRPKNPFQLQVYTDTTIAGVPAERIGLLGYGIATRSYLIRVA